MLTYSFDNIGTESLYEHLYKCLKSDIINGALYADIRLPSKRSFAKNLGVSTITVENAYMQLIAEGYIYSIPKKGYFVADIGKLKGSRNTHMEFLPQKIDFNANHIVSSKDTSTVNHSLESIAGNHMPHQYFADFSSNQTCPDNFPFSIWAKLMREIMSQRSTDLMTNSPSAGIYELRNSIAEHLRDFRGMNVTPEQIIVGAGTEYLYNLIIQLLGHDLTYGVENPGYRKISQIYESNCVNCMHVNIDKQGIILNELRSSGAQVIHISPSHHFPTGIVTPMSRRYELLAWAAEHDSRYIIEDDYDSEFRLTGRPIPPLQSIDAMEKVIYINTFSKSLASTIRISYMVLPEHLAKRFYQHLSFYACTISTFEQYTLAHFIKEGYFEKHINRMRTYYHKQRDHLLDCIDNHPLKQHIQIMEENAGLHFLMKIDLKIDEDEFQRRLATENIRILPLSSYYVNPSQSAEHIYVVNYSNLNYKAIDDAVLKLYRCIE